MGDSKDQDSDKNSIADELIQEALENLDSEGEMAPVEDPRASGAKEKVARIDLQQYVEKEAYMRLAADFDNFRKRALKERQEWERQGKEKALRGAFDVIDNLARGLAQAAEDEGALATGMKMVLSQAEAWLLSEGFERIPSLGEKFNPSVHEAVAQVPNPDKDDGEVVEEIKRGYQWKGRVLRPASVVVVKNADKSPEKKSED